MQISHNKLNIKTGITLLRNSCDNRQGRDNTDLQVELAPSGAGETQVSKTCAERLRCCKHRGTLSKFAIISKYNTAHKKPPTTTRPAPLFKFKEILKVFWANLCSLQICFAVLSCLNI